MRRRLAAAESETLSDQPARTPAFRAYEVNTERFVRLVRDMSRDTQFIVITHSRLYGVTMEAAGCSRLVSVNFAEMES